MSLENWKNQLQTITGLTHYIYLSPMPVVGGLYFLYPPSPNIWREDFGTFFSAIALFSGLTIAIAHWIYGQTLSRETLDMRHRGVGLASAVSSFKVGMILCASLGDLTAFLSIAFYMVTREPIHLGVLLFFWSVHYLLGSLWLRNARSHLLTLLTQERPAEQKAA